MTRDPHKNLVLVSLSKAATSHDQRMTNAATNMHVYKHGEDYYAVSVQHMGKQTVHNIDMGWVHLQKDPYLTWQPTLKDSYIDPDTGIDKAELMGAIARLRAGQGKRHGPVHQKACAMLDSEWWRQKNKNTKFVRVVLRLSPEYHAVFKSEGQKKGFTTAAAYAMHLIEKARKK